ncbi:MAG: Crp/Fnr family transcriptional regulator [Streptosporangiaceae bacterium]|nr:Crp/Fnr family transcriptional regulator [Streptosporangiaceae bacterium]
MRDTSPAGTEGGRQRRWGARNWPEETLLGMLDPAAREQLSAAGEDRRYRAGQVLMREGERGDFVLVLLGGVVKAIGAAFEGRDVLLAVRMSGDLVGEFAAMDRRPRSATVTACGPVSALWIPVSRFRNCLRQEPRIATAVTASITGKLRAANSYRVDFAGCDAATRMTRALYQLAMTYGQRHGEDAVLRLPVTQSELSTLCGVADQTGHRVLRELRSAGVITTGYRAIWVGDLDRLRRTVFGE